MTTNKNSNKAQILPSNWTTINFNDAVELISVTGKKVKKGDYLDDGHYPVIDQGQEFVGGYTNDQAKVLDCEPPVIVFGDHTRIFKFINFPFAAGADGIKPLKPHKFYDPKLLYYFLQTVELPDKGYSRHFKFLRKVILPLPPLTEQEHIVAEIEKQFTRLDTAVSTLNRLQSTLDRYQASLLKAACTGQLLPQDANDEPAERLLQRILAQRRQRWLEAEWQNQIERAQKKAAHAQRKASGRPHNLRDLDPADWQSLPEAEYAPYLPQNDKWQKKYKEPAAAETAGLPDLPPGWVWATWEQLSPRVTVGHVGSMKDEYVEEGIPFLRGQNVRENRYDPEGLKFISPEFDEQLSKSQLKPGDIVVVRSGSVGVTCVIPETLQHANCSDLVIIQKPPHFVPEYGAYYMNSLAKRFIRAGQVGVALIHFNTKSVAALPLPVPPLAEQKRIVEEVERRLSVVTATQQAIRANQTRSGRLRQSILQQAFNGRL